MKLAFDKFVQHVNAGLVKVEDVLANVEVIFGSANQRGTLVRGGCIRVGDRVVNLNPDEIQKFIVNKPELIKTMAIDPSSGTKLVTIYDVNKSLADYLKKLETGPFVFDGRQVDFEAHVTIHNMGPTEQSLESYLKMMGTGPFMYDGEKVEINPEPRPRELLIDYLKRIEAGPFSYDGKKLRLGEPVTLTHRTAGVAPDGKMIKEISSQLGIPLSTVLNVIKAYTGVPMEAVRTIEPERQIENQQEKKEQETGASTETLIQESGQDQGSNLGASLRIGSTLRMDQEASGQVIEGPAKDSESIDD